MPIPLRDYNNLVEKRPKSNKDLLDFMQADQAYTTTNIEEFLNIQHPAALSRLKRLNRLGYIEMKVIGKNHYWHKLKSWPEENKPINVVDAMSATGTSSISDLTELDRKNG